jgi:hypothetical protein
MRNGCLLVLKNLHITFLPNDLNTRQPNNVKDEFLIEKVSALPPPKPNRKLADVKGKQTKIL